MHKTIDEFAVLSFDCYGTLIDWETGIWDALQPLFRDNAVDPKRSDVLQRYAHIEHAQETRQPSMAYGDLLTCVHAELAATLGLRSTTELDARFGHSVALWPAFDDSATALRYLKTRYKLVILSNVDNAGIAASIDKLGVDFDAVYTAQDIGSYKPASANFEYLLAHLERDFSLGKDAVLHTAQSLFHDHVPAKRFGLANAWIDRQRLSDGGDWGATASVDAMPATDFRFYSLGEMADAVRAG